MIRYEYKVIPAPARGLKGKGVKGTEGKFANALQTAMNDMAAEGWEYQRAETLPSEERSGLTSKTTVFRNVLVFRRPVETDVEAFAPQLLEAPEPEAEEPAADAAEPDLADAPATEPEPDYEEDSNLADPLAMRAAQLADKAD